MSTTNRRTFTKQFKQDVVQQSQHCDTITELAADLGLRPELIYRWRSEL
ncbi:transposase [Fodinibius halophilus]|uniref:Transposase n=1 Tax=Fodinibius halophilus TaxID=1736908 RepID=A0A6M1T298_9BACT|nr:transposase [Fodinibius halophilus]NGP88129.1 transposase [Fodinibius halophilus]